MSQHSRLECESVRNMLEEASSHLLLAQNVSTCTVNDPVLHGKIKAALKASQEATDHITDRLSHSVG